MHSCSAVTRSHAIRTSLDLSQQELASLLGLDRTSISRMENRGHESGPVSKLLDGIERLVEEHGAATARRLLVDQISSSRPIPPSAPSVLLPGAGLAGPVAASAVAGPVLSGETVDRPSPAGSVETHGPIQRRGAA